MWTVMRDLRSIVALVVVSSASLLLGTAVHAAQDPAVTDIDEGAATFRSYCATCHGIDGNEIAGIDLGRGVFRRAVSSQDLVQIIRNGIPGTGMPGSGFSDQQASRVVAYLRQLSSEAQAGLGAGVPERGRTVFEGRGQCLSCHRVGDRGGRLGPDLGDIGRTRTSAALERSIVDPDAEVLGTNRFYRVTTADGTVVTGRLLNLDSYSVQMLDTHEMLRSFEKSTLRSYAFGDRSPMPSYKEKLSGQELADLVSYLKTLRSRP
jgi:putative heme-binding domain-containing protein